MRWGSLLALVCCACAGSACVSAADEHAAARARVDAHLQERLGATPRTTASEAEVQERVQQLLHDGLSEAEAAQLALSVQRSVQARLASLGAGAAEFAQAMLWANPVLGGDLVWMDGGTEVELSLAQPLADVLLAPLRRAKSGAELRALEAEVTASVVDAVFHARRAHVAARLAQQELDLITAQLGTARAAESLMRDLAEAGNITPVELAHARAEAERWEQTRAEAERDWWAAREVLNRATGLWGVHTQWVLAVEAPRDPLADEPNATVDLTGVEARAVQASLELAAARARMEAQAHSAGIQEWSTILPDAQLGLAAKKDADDASWGLGPAGAVALPLLDAGSTANYAAQARLQTLAEQYWSLAVDLRSAARTARERLRGYSYAARHARTVLVPAERSVVEETLRNFNAMQIGAFDVLVARRNELAAERRAVQLEAAAHQARLDLDELLAGHWSRSRTEPSNKETSDEHHP